MTVRTLILTAVVVATLFALVGPSVQTTPVVPRPKAEDDFQIVKVADGVYAAIAICD